MKYPKIVTVIGASGTMGKLVSAIVASFGKAEVYMVCRNLNRGEKAREEAINSIRAESIKERLKVVSHEQMVECIKKSDWIFESIVEDESEKLKINNIINLYAKADAIISTGTSGLSVTKLAKHLSVEHQKYYLGTHFFNPPYQLTLCELIPTPYTNQDFLCEMKEYMEKVLLRDTVLVKDKAGFLGNRVGFGIMNEAIRMADYYRAKGGIDYIDTLLGPFTGRSMPPIMTLDFVGLDIYKAIVDHLYKEINDYTKNTFKAPLFIDKFIQEGRLGKKSGEGLYKSIQNQQGKKEKWVYDIQTNLYRELKYYSFPCIEELKSDLSQGDYQKGYIKFIQQETEESKICLQFILKGIIYALTVQQDVAFNEKAVDRVMTTGFNWAPPLGMIHLLGGSKKVKELCQRLLEKEMLDKIDLDKIFYKEFPLDYDYRPYLKAKR